MDDSDTTPSPNPTSEDTGANADQVSVIKNLEELIVSKTTRADKLREEIKQRREMLDDILVNDETYKNHSETAKAATKVKTATKQQLMKAPQATKLTAEVKSLRSEMKELQDSLSEYLQEYHRLSGSREIEGPDGEVREIIYVAKLVKKSPSAKFDR